MPQLVEQLAGTSRARNMSRLRLRNLSFTQLLEFVVEACASSPELKDKADALIAEVAPLASTHQDAHILRETSKLSLERKVVPSPSWGILSMRTPSGRSSGAVAKPSTPSCSTHEEPCRPWSGCWTSRTTRR